MKKTILAFLLSGLLLLSACAAPEGGAQDSLRIVATTYPAYLFTTAVTEGVEGVEVTLMVSQPTSCLHDYTLTVNDMKALDRADVVVINGAGLEDFMADALAQSGARTVDCSAGIDLLLAEGHEEHDGHDHDEEHDPHLWMDPVNAAVMVDNIGAALSALDPDHAADYAENAAAAADALFTAWKGWQEKTVRLVQKDIITFHDGFRYFANAFGLNLLKAIEEEEGAETSAKEIQEIVDLIDGGELGAISRKYGLMPPVGVFTEVNGSDATAKAIARETGVDIHQLNMIMSGEGTGIQPYLDAMDANINAVMEALG